MLGWLADHQFEGKEYSVSRWLTTWEWSDAACAANDATLASAATIEEDVFLRDTFVQGSVTLVVLYGFA